MACKPIICSVCKGTFPACQIKDGKCATCRSKEALEREALKSQPPQPKTSTNITHP